MKLNTLFPLVVASLAHAGVIKAHPTVEDTIHKVTYQGVQQNSVDQFLNIPYGHDTGGRNRFKKPRPYVPRHGAVIHATSHGFSCPRKEAHSTPHRKMSENCLNLNIARPTVSDCANDQAHLLPVMVFLGGVGADADTNAEKMILESVQNGSPIVHVAVNARSGVLGFAKADELNREGSENVGLRDQRLALEWVRDHIGDFGGNPNNVTIFGQGSVEMQIMAYGGKNPAPFQQAISHGSSIAPGITGNSTAHAMQTLLDRFKCNKNGLHSKQSIECLRHVNVWQLVQASGSPSTWLPTVDGDFLPAAPSQLIQSGSFAKLTTALGWCENSMALEVERGIHSPNETRAFLHRYLPGLSNTNLDKILSSYKASEFSENKSARLSQEFFRATRILRDASMVCPSLLFAQHVSKAGNKLYLYNWNQTIFDDASNSGDKSDGAGMGPVDGSEIPFIYGTLPSGSNLPKSNATVGLMHRGSRSWSNFAATGNFTLKGHETFQNFIDAFVVKDNIHVFVAGGSSEGVSPIDGSWATPAMSAQKLRERCELLTSTEILSELQF